MGFDLNECFDVQRNFIWEKEVWILALRNTLAPRVKTVMRLSGSQCRGWSTFSHQDNMMTTQQHKPSDITGENNYRKHCEPMNNYGLLFVSYIVLVILNKTKKHCARVASISANIHDVSSKYRWMINTGCKVTKEYYCIVNIAPLWCVMVLWQLNLE